MAKILVVDDERPLTETLQILLETNGDEVITALDGHEGLEKARAKYPDLILLDVLLPKMDGYKVCSLLKHDVKYNKIPIILLTGKDQDSFVKAGKKVGANAFFTKPADPSALLGKIDELLKKHK